MRTFRHSTTGRPIGGMRLYEGAILQSGDVYDSTTGDWLACAQPGLKLSPGAGATWVRPEAKLSSDAKVLLSGLVTFECCLAKRADWPSWMKVSSLNRGVGFMPEYAAEETVVQELIDVGLIAPLRADPEMYEVSDFGYEFVKTIFNQFN